MFYIQYVSDKTIGKKNKDFLSIFPLRCSTTYLPTNFNPISSLIGLQHVTVHTMIDLIRIGNTRRDTHVEFDQDRDEASHNHSPVS